LIEKELLLVRVTLCAFALGVALLIQTYFFMHALPEGLREDLRTVPGNPAAGE
jgi:hypothetical protein